MNELNILEKIKIIEDSNDISMVSLAAMPKISNDNYYFVSYSHKDYKEVYKMILYLQNEGINIWYDRGLPPGRDWEIEVERSISKFNCAGVILFTSENYVTSSACVNELKLITRYKKDYLSINIPKNGKYYSGYDLYIKSNSDLSYKKIINDMLGNHIIYIQHNEEIDKIIDKISLLKKELLFNYKVYTYKDRLGTPGQACITSIKNIDIVDVEIPQYIKEDDKSYQLSQSGLGKAVFANCRNLRDVKLPRMLYEIPSMSFFQCHNLVNINLENVDTIGNEAFYGCKSLKEINIGPHGTPTKIKEKAFAECENLSVVKLRSIEELAEDAFDECKNIESVYTDYYSWSKINFKNENHSPLRYGANLYFDNKLVEDVTRKITYQITPYMFSKCKSIKHVYGLDKITEISEYAFSNCKNLETVVIPASCEVVKKGAFENCINLKSVIFEGENTKIEPSAFKGCSSLVDVNLPSNLKELPDYAFYDCSKLNKINLPSSLEVIGHRAFSLCKSLIEVTVPNNVELLDDETFFECTNLVKVTLPSNLNKISTTTFNGCYKLFKIINNSLFDNEEIKSIVLKQGTNIIITNNDDKIINKKGLLFLKDEYEIPTLVNYIGRYKDIILPDDISNTDYIINHYAFAENDKIRNIIIPSSVRLIGVGAFFGCRNLEEITIEEDSIEMIPPLMLYGCKNLKWVNIYSNIKKIFNKAFEGCENLNFFYLPDSCEEICEESFKGCANLLCVRLGKNMKIIHEQAFEETPKLNIMYNHSNYIDNDDLPVWLAYDDTVNRFTFIDNLVFFKDKYTHLIHSNSIDKHITLPKRVNRCKYYIDEMAFNKSNIESITISNGVKEIGINAFRLCQDLKTVNIEGNSLKTINPYAFFGCTDLKYVNFPQSIDHIGDYSFITSTNLNSVSIYENTKFNPETVFAKETKIKIKKLKN